MVHIKKNILKKNRDITYHTHWLWGFSETAYLSTLCDLVTKSCPILCNPMNCNPPGSLSMGFPRQEYWIVLPFPSPEDLLHSGIEPGSPASQADSLPTEPPGKSNLKFLPNLSPPMVSPYSSDKKIFLIFICLFIWLYQALVQQQDLHWSRQDL